MKKTRNPILRQMEAEVHSDPKAQEHHAGKLIGGRRRGGSGANAFAKGDAISESFLLEAKQTTKGSYSLNTDTLTKISREAIGENRTQLMHIHFQGPVDPIMPRSWVVIAEKDFKRLLERAGSNMDDTIEHGG